MVQTKLEGPRRPAPEREKPRTVVRLSNGLGRNRRKPPKISAECTRPQLQWPSTSLQERQRSETEANLGKGIGSSVKIRQREDVTH